MIVCVQIVSGASLSVSGEVKGVIGHGLYVLVGVESGDSERNCVNAAEKVCNMRIFSGENGKMSLSVKDIGGEVLSVSQFTLAADTSKGNRPDFGRAEKPERAENLYNLFTNHIRSIIGADKVATGIFGADMSINALNEGPVTIIFKR